MSLLDRLAHARVFERPSASARASALGIPTQIPTQIPTPTPTTVSGAASSGAAFERRERFIDLEPDPAIRHARSFAPNRAGERSSLLGGCLGRVTLPGSAALACDLVCLGARAAGRAVFLDLETTGLGGASVPYVVGLAWMAGTQLHCTQWTLARCSGEAELLADVLARLEAHGPAPLVSFNGASFDVPLLRLRAHRYGLSARVLEAEHVDLLHPARRLQRGRGRDCRLATLERELLGIRRQGDIESAEIPEVFWTWVQSPNDTRAQRRLRAVCDHNLVDLASLPALANWLANAVREPGDLDRALRAARHLDRLGASEQARLVLARWVDVAPRVGAGGGGARWREAALALASLERRAGDRERAAELVRAAWLADPGCPDASEAWAKVLEHQLGDFVQALRVARGSRQLCERRVARLEARVSRKVESVRPGHVGQPPELPPRRPAAELAPRPSGAELEIELSPCTPSRTQRSRLDVPELPVAPKPGAAPRIGLKSGSELLARVDQLDPAEGGAAVRYRLLR